MDKLNGDERRKKTNINPENKKSKFHFSTLVNFALINLTGG